MSRVAKSKVNIPNTVSVMEKNKIVEITSKANKEKSFQYKLPNNLKIEITDNKLSVIPINENDVDVAIWGTTLRNIKQKIEGLDKPFETNVDLVGVGYKAQVSGKNLIMDLGFSHKIEYDLGDLVHCKVEKGTKLMFSSHDKVKLGQVVGEIIKIRPPEPYKGKGIIKEGTYVLRKEGKKKNA